MKGLSRLLEAMSERHGERFSKALAALPGRNRDVVKSALAGEAQAVTAARLGVSQPAVSSMLRNSIGALSEVLTNGR